MYTERQKIHIFGPNLVKIKIFGRIQLQYTNLQLNIEIY